MFLNVTISLLQSLAATMEIFFLTLLFSLPLGLVIAFGSMSKWAPLRFLLYGQEAPGALTRTLAAFRPIGTVCGILVWIIRGTPLMLQLIAVFYVPGLLGCGLWGGPVGRMSATVVTFTLNYACYFSVIYRGGIQGVPLGQREAGEVLGMTKRQIFFKVTLLQMIKRIVPPMSNEVINLVKDTSLARIIAVYELTFTGYSFMKSAGLIWPLFYSGAFYLLFVGVLTILFNRIERRLDYFK
ncbi:MAG: amino acid ABC transporter permease [Clostridiales bacterium]|mgnify:FL=1|nr:amino acid ABC transporter permease [Clostridiales bacterium]